MSIPVGASMDDMERELKAWGRALMLRLIKRQYGVRRFFLAEYWSVLFFGLK